LNGCDHRLVCGAVAQSAAGRRARRRDKRRSGWREAAGGGAVPQGGVTSGRRATRMPWRPKITTRAKRYALDAVGDVLLAREPSTAAKPAVHRQARRRTRIAHAPHRCGKPGRAFPLRRFQLDERGVGALLGMTPRIDVGHEHAGPPPLSGRSSNTFVIDETRPLSRSDASIASAESPAGCAARPPAIHQRSPSSGSAASGVTVAMTVSLPFFGGFTSCSHWRYRSCVFVMVPRRDVRHVRVRILPQLG
jgi:hypothetical protein